MSASIQDARHLLLVTARACRRVVNDPRRTWDPTSWEYCALGLARQEVDFRAPGLEFMGGTFGPGEPEYRDTYAASAIMNFFRDKLLPEGESLATEMRLALSDIYSGLEEIDALTRAELAEELAVKLKE